MHTAMKSPKRKRKTVMGLLLIGALLLAWPLFRMFEPVLTWSSGWLPLPEELDHQTSHTDAGWTAIAAQADAALAQSRKQLQAPALSAAIMVDGTRVWASAVGLADIAASRPVDLSSSFRVGSTSKVVNALAMGRLIDAGKLDIDRSVRHYLLDLPPAYDGVTTRHAISHTAGIPDYSLCLCFPLWEHRSRRHFDGVRDALQVFEHRPLLFAPGDGFQYSSYGTNVSGAVIEAVAGTPYNRFVADAVLRPLQMNHSAADVAGADYPHRVAFYDITEGQYKPAYTINNSIRYPSGGLLSTPSDMLAVGNALLGDGLLSDATRHQLLTRQKLRDGSDNPQGYALGIRVFDDKEILGDTVTTAFYTHHGTAVGSTSYFAVYPEYGVVVSMMMNKGQENLDAMAVEAQRLVELFIAEQLRRENDMST